MILSASGLDGRLQAPDAHGHRVDDEQKGEDRYDLPFALRPACYL